MCIADNFLAIKRSQYQKLKIYISSRHVCISCVLFVLADVKCRRRGIFSSQQRRHANFMHLLLREFLTAPTSGPLFDATKEAYQPLYCATRAQKLLMRARRRTMTNISAVGVINLACHRNPKCIHLMIVIVRKLNGKRRRRTAFPTARVCKRAAGVCTKHSPGLFELFILFLYYSINPRRLICKFRLLGVAFYRYSL
jgi:hypothetical protein